MDKATTEDFERKLRRWHKILKDQDEILRSSDEYEELLEREYKQKKLDAKSRIGSFLEELRYLRQVFFSFAPIKYLSKEMQKEMVLEDQEEAWKRFASTNRELD